MATVYDPTKDPYAEFAKTPGALGTNASVGGESDTVDFDPYPKAIEITAVGDITVLPLKADEGDFITYTAVPSGHLFPFRIRRVKTTGLTASFVKITD